MGAQFEISKMNNIMIKLTGNTRKVAVLPTPPQSKRASPMAEENVVKCPLIIRENMNNIMIRLTGNARKVAVLPTPPQSKRASPMAEENNVKCPLITSENMNNIILRPTGNARKVVILTTPPQSKRASLMAEENVVKCPMITSEVKKEYVNLKSKCFFRYQNFNGKQQLPEKQNQNKSNINNNVGNRLIELSKELTLHKETKEGLNGRKLSIEFKSMKPPTVQKSNNKSILNPKEIKITMNSKQEEGEEETCLRSPSITSLISNISNFDDSPDEKPKHKHPNRRLESERAECDLPLKRARYTGHVVNKQLCSKSSKIQRKGVTFIKQVVSSEIKLKKKERDEESQTTKNKHVWEHVLDLTEESWIHVKKEETVYIKDQSTISGSETVDIKSLNEFVKQKTEEKEREEAKVETLYENRVKDMLKYPNSSDIIREFYIPPALAEMFRYNLAQGHTAEERLRKLCEIKKWPKPTFTCKSTGKEGWLYSCNLKSKTFLPTKPASNEDLAKELAALECLDWLGIQPNALKHASPFDDEYLSWRGDLLK